MVRPAPGAAPPAAPPAPRGAPHPGAARHSSGEAPRPPPVTPVAPTPTTEPVPDDAHVEVAFDAGDYAISIYDDGYLDWHGRGGVRAIGERRARVPEAQVDA